MKIFKLTAIGAMLFAVCGLAVPQTSYAQQTKTEGKQKVFVANSSSDPVKEVAPGEKIPAKPKVLTIIDFNATWCGPCQQFKPVFHKLAKEYKGKIQFLSVDVDKCPELAEQFKVQYIPQITAIKPNGSQKTQTGAMDETQFRNFIKEMLK